MKTYSHSPKQLYIIRHGRTEYNHLGLVQGSGVDSDLDEIGRKQAQHFYQHYQHIGFDKIYTSALRRTHQTVAPFVVEQQIPMQPLKGLNEISWGNKEGRAVTPEEDRAYFKMIEGWRSGLLHLKIPDGETPLEVYERQQKALEIIMANPKEEKVLVCMHGRAMKIFLCLLLGIDLSKMDDFSHSNTCLYRVDYVGENQFELVINNCTRHLERLPQNQMVR
ncbi:histidine phosphatase family protein [Hugenholtzia roseola]|uniref:histidine phosphatase family protein n=1 Tax=Hugenholtzia roseola TaxID=1002 RepID=UPI000478817B|nr:histidine phosphatase family protein [Hugenholtzia roseola]